MVGRIHGNWYFKYSDPVALLGLSLGFPGQASVKVFVIWNQPSKCHGRMRPCRCGVRLTQWSCWPAAQRWTPFEVQAPSDLHYRRPKSCIILHLFAKVPSLSYFLVWIVADFLLLTEPTSTNRLFSIGCSWRRIKLANTPLWFENRLLAPSG
jgi:hypothetical protein